MLRCGCECDELNSKQKVLFEDCDDNEKLVVVNIVWCSECGYYELW